jgi:hypothetical protein
MRYIKIFDKKDIKKNVSGSFIFLEAPSYYIKSLPIEVRISRAQDIVLSSTKKLQSH